MTNEELNIILKRLKEFTYILIKQIKESKEIFITTHKNPDFDAISSALAVALISKQLKKDTSDKKASIKKLMNDVFK